MHLLSWRDGAGVEGAYEEALIGDASLTELTRVIDQTMPDANPKLVRPKIPWRSLHTFIKPSTAKRLRFEIVHRDCTDTIDGRATAPKYLRFVRKL